ncbi:serine hydrolase domain-containing protein [Mycobacterium sp.]|uniref:serine hydrolase domain-containing protein n=1 Tax=Mycobacterium sp. TaxID=1785 RepID=UPI002BEC6171|nr:serine hydrolase domain-containing protein [Mycobacterium sp.]HME46566.1 serine hydrolase domain-containing protein [Mycobacterium sp.]
MVLRVKVSPDLIAGEVDEGYGKVADVFRRNMTSGHEVGAAVTVYRDGVKVVDLWGGFRNGITKAPWEHDTVVNMFSTTKGVSSLAIAVAAAQGLVSYDAKVADYWPQFAQASKGTVTVRQLLSHQAGLPAIDAPLTLQDLADPTKMSTVLAAQAPAWTPGTRHGYHAVTLGWYESELIRHADPSGRSLGQFFAEEVAQPLGLEFYIGLPASVDRSRVAHLHGWSPAELLLHLRTLPPRFVAAILNSRSVTARTFGIPRGVNSLEDFNREEVRVVEIPAGNGIGTVRSVAKAYGCVATGGSDLGLTPSVLDALAKPAIPPAHGLRDKVLHVDTTFSLGYGKPTPKFRFGSSDKAFGHNGLGGSFGFADPDTGIGFAYAMNRLGFHLWSDPRELALRQVLFHDIVGARSQT